MKKLLSVLIVILTCASLFSCGAAPAGNETETDAPKKPSEALIGVWKNELGGYVYTFNPDGTGSYDAAGKLLPFTYTATDSVVSVAYDGNDGPVDLEYEVADNLLNVKDVFGNDTFYVRQSDG